MRRRLSFARRNKILLLRLLSDVRIVISTFVPLVVITVSCALPVEAGSAQAQIVKTSRFEKWLCGGRPETSKPAYSCGVAEFEKCAPCYTVVVENTSTLVTRASVEIQGSGFTNAAAGQAIVSCGPGPGSRDSKSGCARLSPGESCFESIEFCPEQSGLSEAQVKVTTSDGVKAQTTIFNLSGRAIYSRDLQAADRVRKRHLEELVKIPNVEKVKLRRTDGKIAIAVEVRVSAIEDEVSKVKRAVPQRIEGYPVEVTPQVLVEPAL